jgi:hypothetical protein
MSKIDEYVTGLLDNHIQAIAKLNNSNPKFMKGFMDVEFDPFVVSMEGDEGWQIHPCGSKYVWLDDSIVLNIEQWIEDIRPEYDRWIEAEIEEIDRNSKPLKNKVVLIKGENS